MELVYDVLSIVDGLAYDGDCCGYWTPPQPSCDNNSDD